VRGDILLSHAHWDHIQGFPFFAPIFGRGNHFTVLGAQALETSVDRVLRDQMSPVVFPVTFEELDATIDFEQVGADVRVAHGYELRAMPVRHPGGALAFRLNETGTPHRALVYVTDNELGAAARYDMPPDWRERFVAWIRGAAVLIHDAMYTDGEYDHHRGWGHSTYQQAVDLALEAAVDTLVLFHHKPERGDEEVDQQVEACRRLVHDRGGAVHVIAAAEGMSLTV
jgi:ribonuclease BN (tRNA processing enzyme)